MFKAVQAFIVLIMFVATAGLLCGYLAHTTASAPPVVAASPSSPLTEAKVPVAEPAPTPEVVTTEPQPDPPVQSTPAGDEAAAAVNGCMQTNSAVLTPEEFNRISSCAAQAYGLQ